MGDPQKYLDIRPFSWESNQDITLYLKRYTRVVDATLPSDATEAIKKAAYLRLLPTKLDDIALQIYEASDNNTNWDNLKAELIEKFSDPAKSQHFQSNVDAVKWDGESPLILYQNKILSAIRLHDSEIVANDTLLDREVFKRFLAGLPGDYRTYVDAGLPVGSTDVKLARERAEKYKDLLAKNKGVSPLATWMGGGLPVNPAAAAAVAAVQNAAAPFAAFKNPSVDNLTEQIGALSLAHRENLEMQRETNKSISSLIDHLTSKSQSENYRSRAHSPGNNYGRPSGRSPASSPFRSPNRGFDPNYNRPPSRERRQYENQRQNAGYPQQNFQPHYQSPGRSYPQNYGPYPRGNQSYQGNGPSYQNNPPQQFSQGPQFQNNRSFSQGPQFQNNQSFSQGPQFQNNRSFSQGPQNQNGRPFPQGPEFQQQISRPPSQGNQFNAPRPLNQSQPHNGQSYGPQRDFNSQNHHSQNRMHPSNQSRAQGQSGHGDRSAMQNGAMLQTQEYYDETAPASFTQPKQVSFSVDENLCANFSQPFCSSQDIHHHEDF